MTTEELYNEIKTLSHIQQESVYSFVYLLKHPEYMYASEQVKTEPFANERETMDFVNDCTERILYESGEVIKIDGLR